MKPRKLLSALEDNGAPTSSQALETEVVLYARIGNPGALEQAASSEQHVQLESEFTNGVRCRVRKVVKGEETKYIFTYKLKNRQDQDNQIIESSKENNTEVDEAFFEDFYNVAYREIKKTRYIFDSNSVTLTLAKNAEGEDAQKIELPNVQFEVDVFEDQPKEGDISGGQLWCKIDVEVDNILNAVRAQYPELKEVKLHLGVSNLPFSPKDIIQSTSDNAQDREQISELWKSFAKSLVDMTPAK